MTSEHQQGPSEAKFLQDWLSSRDVPCPVCGYNLRSTEATRCPECGAKLDLRVGSTDLRIGLWLVGVIALTLPLGFIGLFVLFYAPALAVSGISGGGLALSVVASATVLTVSYVLLLWRLIRSRKKFWSKPRRAQKISVVLYILAGSAPVTLPIAIVWLESALF